MYSRSVNSQTSRPDGLRVPKNYSGNAFSYAPPKYEPPVERESDVISRSEPAAKKEEVPTNEPCEAPASEPKCEKCEKCEKEEKKDSLLFGLSFEDLLLIALILILSQNGAEDDILILLALILAYKK